MCGSCTIEFDFMPSRRPQGQRAVTAYNALSELGHAVAVN